MGRDSLSLDQSVSFEQFKPKLDHNKTQTNEELPIKEVAQQHGFTRREFKSNQEIYNHQFNARCRAVISEIVSDIAYIQRLKKQDIFELAIIAFLEKHDMKDLIEKYHTGLNRV